jgi:hypothetical protein
VEDRPATSPYILTFLYVLPPAHPWPRRNGSTGRIPRSNRDGIGSEVKVVARGLTQYDTVRSGGSYLSSSDLRLHFGLGSATEIDRLELHWPSGQTDTIQGPPVDHLLVIEEGKGLVKAEPFRRP